jgi:hypothetical protein
MKLTASSLKTFDYKQFFINHGEKVAIALIGLMMAAFLYGTNWKATDKTPTELIDRAKKAQQEIEEHPWPADKKQALGQGTELAGKVAQLLSPVNAAAFAIAPFNSPLHPDKTLVSMPKWLPVDHLIASYGVAEFTMQPGVPPLDDGFIRNKPKEKEPRGKALRDRAKRREQTPPKKKEDEEENPISEEFRRKEGQAGGQGGGQMGGRLNIGRALARRLDKKGRKSEEANEADKTPAPKVAAKPTGRGYRFVAVRGVFPLKNQIAELARAMGLATNQKNLQGMVQFRDFKLERQTRIDRQGADPWSGPWEVVDRDPVIQLLENDVIGYAPETVLYDLVDGHICMPYPERMVGQWGDLATHPDIKEFSLSDEEVEQQVEYEWKLLEKVQKEDEKVKAPVDKRGFMGVTKDMRALSARGQRTEGEDISPREKILRDLESGTGDKEKIDEQLAEFVRNRATPADHFVLFRYLDLKIDPGKTYRYRVKLTVANPFHNKHVEEVTDPSIIEGEERETEYSEPTVPVTVKEDAQFFVKRVDSHVGRPSLPSAEMDFFQWFAETGTVVNKVLRIQIGQILGGRERADVLRPAEEIFDSEKVLFSTNDALVDVSSGFSLDPSLHKDIVDNLVPGAKRTGDTVPSETLVADENGELHVIDGLDQKADYDQTKTHYDQQNKAFESLRTPADDDLQGRHGLFGKGLGMGADKKGKGDPRRRGFGYGRGKDK